MEKEICLSVIIPVYNEEKVIKNTLFEVNCFFANKNYGSEIIIVDDGSNDNTAVIAKKLKSIIKNLTVLENKKNYGKGYSVKRGILAAKGKYRLFMDADNSTRIEQVGDFISFLENEYDVVIGNRDMKESKIKKHQPFYKEILGNTGNILIRILAVPGIKDTQCGFKCFSDKFVKDVFPKLTIDRWGFDIEILALAKKFGYKIKSAPVIWKNKNSSKVYLKDYVFTLVDLFKIKINLITKKYDKQ